ncbi:hypothetical protein DICPUDRAFT_42045 [Dictyostelium purpureum]|uniref:Zinc finger CHCC-type domain-containing protein n=1 Tax=Dictyostelium purpureum TaxID=5786 RepID=F1A197_DICPU|nr:uncharacterized protein DICPUDRAFT_42045 [Dictyostelium purpureum]EGC30033.1 hypothetical protein DICPUDRAFT_42045 [Dictyostelium purpureum]|eukprot:XP_003293444.1 hypothetical protein DICPUDRAFT_42045 [Dictyostelium purpureum]
MIKNFANKLNQALRTTGPTIKFTPPPSDVFNVKPVESAENLIHQVKPIEVQDSKIGCDGGNGPLGHPMVYINLEGNTPQSCGYCGLRFIQKHGHHHHH